MLVSVIALVLALAGTSVAASHYIITSKKQIAPKVLKALKGNRGARGATGAQGPAGATGATGAAGRDGAAGAPGAAGTARAYALISSGGAINTARSKNVVSVTNPGAGVWCVVLDPSVSAAATAASATIDYSDGPTVGNSIAQLASSNGACSGNYISVITRVLTTGASSGSPVVATATNEGFFVVIP